MRRAGFGCTRYSRLVTRAGGESTARTALLVPDPVTQRLSLSAGSASSMIRASPHIQPPNHQPGEASRPKNEITLEQVPEYVPLGLYASDLTYVAEGAAPGVWKLSR